MHRIGRTRTLLLGVTLAAFAAASQAGAPHALAIFGSNGGGGTGENVPCNISNGNPVKPAGSTFTFQFQLCDRVTGAVVPLGNQNLYLDPTAGGNPGNGGALALMQFGAVSQQFVAHGPGSSTPLTAVTYIPTMGKTGGYQIVLQTDPGTPPGSYQLFMLNPLDPFGTEYWLNLTIK